MHECFSFRVACYQCRWTNSEKCLWAPIRLITKACWLLLVNSLSLFRNICTFSRIFAITGSTEICLKSLSIFSGGWTMGTGLTKACSYMVGYLFCTILAVMICVLLRLTSGNYATARETLILNGLSSAEQDRTARRTTKQKIWTYLKVPPWKQVLLKEQLTVISINRLLLKTQALK